MSSSIRTRQLKNNTTMGGYLVNFILTTRINKGFRILEIPLLKKDLVHHKVLITDGVTPIIGVVVQEYYIFVLTETPSYYTPGAQVYILTEKYKQSELEGIYLKYKQTLTDVLYFVREVEGASISIYMSFDVDYNTIAGTPELSDVLEADFIRALSDSLGIDSKRIVVTGITPGRVVITFLILESPDATSQTPLDIGEELKFQLSKKDSSLYTYSLFRKATSLNISVVAKYLPVNDPAYLFLRDYNINIYEKIINEELDVLGDIFEFLNITIE
jgi:hypothetical protein